MQNDELVTVVRELIEHGRQQRYPSSAIAHAIIPRVLEHAADKLKAMYVCVGPGGEQFLPRDAAIRQVRHSAHRWVSCCLED